MYWYLSSIKEASVAGMEWAREGLLTGAGGAKDFLEPLAWKCLKRWGG